MSKIVLEFSRKEIDLILDSLEIAASAWDAADEEQKAEQLTKFAAELEIASRQ